MQNFTKQQIADACRTYGPLVYTPPSITGAQMLWAIAGVESSFGADCAPRHEPAYDKGGMYGGHWPQTEVLARLGSAGACSYGPWQVLIANCPLGTSPSAFASLDAAAKLTLAFMNSLFRHWQPKTLEQVGECWNAGHITPDPTYEAKLRVAYHTAIVPASI